MDRSLSQLKVLALWDSRLQIMFIKDWITFGFYEVGDDIIEFWITICVFLLGWKINYKL